MQTVNADRQPAAISLLSHLFDKLYVFGKKLVERRNFLLLCSDDALGHFLQLRVFAIAKLSLCHVYRALVVDTYHHCTVNIGIAGHFLGRHLVVWSFIIPFMSMPFMSMPFVSMAPPCMDDEVPVLPPDMDSLPGFICIWAKAKGCSSAMLRTARATDVELILLG